MKDRFIYVFSEESRDLMLANQYTILKSDSKNNIYVFDNKPNHEVKLGFSFENIDYVLSDTLTF